MNPRLIALVGILGAFAGAAPAAASAGPIWNLDLHHAPTNVAPGARGEIWVDLANVGDASSDGSPITLTVKLPSGLARQSIAVNSSDMVPLAWSCPGSAGETTIVCTTTGLVRRHTVSRGLLITVKAGASASGELTAEGTVSGGGGAATGGTVTLPISAEPAGFGIEARTVQPGFFESDGLTPEREAGSAPDLFTFPFDVNTVPSPTESEPTQKAPVENLRDLKVDLPPGFVGNPSAVGECSAAEFTVGECPASSQVGRIDLRTIPVGSGVFVWDVFSVGVYNLSHPRGVVADLAIQIAGNPIHIKASLDPANDYAISSSVSDVNETLPLFDQKLTLWGVPADHSHDSERCGYVFETTGECPIEAFPRAFLTLPSQCETAGSFRLFGYDSWSHPGVFGPEIDHTQPGGPMTHCGRARFEPAVEVEPTGRQASSPTGLDVHISVPQIENPNMPVTPPVKSTTVTLPKGMSFSPSFADGLQSCSLAQMKLGTNEPVACPDASRIGEVTLRTPLLPKAAEGSMYLAAQGDNPFGSLFAMYLVLHDTEERGVLLKIPGRIDVDPASGQITTSFDDLPQFPFQDLTLKFRSGPRAPLVNPPTCGTQEIGVEMASWAQPHSPVNLSNSYQVSEGPNGTPCPPSLSARPFAPKSSGGTLNPVAGSYSPFVFRLSREDQEQELSRVTTALPEGLVAKLAGVATCSDAALASISGALGTGRAEQEHPSCPAASRVGVVYTGLGAGPGLDYVPGDVYLAGPYKGAPLSLAVVVPGLAGPFDLGNVVVRIAVNVDPRTARVTAVSDSLPTILHGVILRVRDVRLRVDRPETTLNPTSCEPRSIDAEVAGAGGDLESTADDSLFRISSRFQVGDCGNLGFKPRIYFTLKGGTKRSDHPALRARLKMPPGGADIGSASVALPHSEFLDQGSLNRVCTRPQFAAKACPKGSIYGRAVARTPLFDFPLAGNVYLGTGYGHKLPDLVAELKGPSWMPVEVDLNGRIDELHGGIRTTFEGVPDAPVSEFTLRMRGGRRGLLENSTDLCRHRHRYRVVARFTGQNGAFKARRPVLRTRCKGKKGGGRKAGKKRR